MTLKPIITTLLLLSTMVFAQANNNKDEYKNEVREKLQLDYSMPDYSTSKVNPKVMGPRLAKIFEKIIDMSH